MEKRKKRTEFTIRQRWQKANHELNSSDLFDKEMTFIYFQLLSEDNRMIVNDVMSLHDIR